MPSWRAIAHAAFLLAPWVCAALTALPWLRARLRTAVLVAGAISLALAVALFAGGHGGAGQDRALGGLELATGGLFRVDALTLPVLPMVSLLWLTGLLMAPVHTFTASRARRSTLSFALLCAAFSTHSLALLGVAWFGSSALFLLEHRHLRRVVRVAGIYLGASVLAFVGGASLLSTDQPRLILPGAIVLGLAVVIRKGILPLHSWLVESFEHGLLVPTIQFSMPQLGTYVAAVVLVPQAPAVVLTGIAIAAVVTSLYGAVLGLAERDARRAVGHLFLSQSALVLAGMDTATESGVGGSLAVWLSSAIASAGLAFTLAALESRRGRLSLSAYHGGFERMPILSGTFLVLGLATVGFPLTMGFFGHELLVTGSVERFPYLGFALIAATALNGVTVARMYFSLFCGRRVAPVALSLRRREVAALTALALVLIAGGVFPRRFVESRSLAARQLLESRSVSHAAPASAGASRR